MMSGDAHDELASSMDAVAAAQAQVAEREQQSVRVSVGCATRDGDGAGGSGSEAARALEGGDGGVVMGREGVVGVELGASSAAREADDDDDDEAMAGDENISMQMAEGSGGVTAGIKKKKGKRGKQKSCAQRKALAIAKRRLAEGDASGS